MINPPPNDELLRGVGKGALAPTFKVNKVELYDLSEEENEIELILKSSFQEAIQDDYDDSGEVESSWYNNNEYTENLKLRLILTCDAQVAKRLDFLQQRFNEYTAGNMGPVNPDSGNLLPQLIQRLARNGTRDNILEQLMMPMGPFDAGGLNEYFKNQQSHFYYYDIDPDFRKLKQTLVYEMSAVNLLQKDRNGNIKRSLTNKSVLTGDGRQFHQLQEIFSKPIKINLTEQNGIFPLVRELGISQLSIYSFSYFDQEGYTQAPLRRRMDQPDAVLPTVEVGMGYVSPSNFVGQYVSYLPQDSKLFESQGLNTVMRDPSPGENPNLLVGMVNPQEIPAPDASSLEDFRQQTVAALQNLPRRIFENISEKTDKSYVGGKRKVLIGDTAHLTPLWISKDTSEDFRYIFGFSLRSFLINNSKFPWLYQNSKSAKDLIQNAQSDFDRTEIMSYDLYRSLAEFDQFGNDNSLGTSLKVVEKELGVHNPEKRLEQPAEIRNLFFEQDDVPDILFFEGVDNLRNEKDSQRISKFKYRAKFCVKDASENYIRKHIMALQDHAKMINKIYDMITNSPEDDGVLQMDDAPFSSGVNLFDYSSLTIKVPLSFIILEQNGDFRRTAASVVDEAISFYVTSLENFGVIGAQQKQDITNQLDALANSNNPDGLTLVKSTLEEFYNNLLGILGDSKLRFVGDGSEKRKQKLENKGIYESGYSILELDHFFDSFPTTGLTFQTGYEIVKQTNQNSNFYGLMRISRNQFVDRTVQEFGKYFYSTKNALPVEDLAYSAQYGNSTAAFLTPEIIRTAGKQSINQLAFKEEDSIATTYDLDRYGELFVDLSKINKKSNYLNGTYYILQDEIAGINKNKQLYNSLSNVLLDQHSFSLNFENELQIPPLDSSSRQGQIQVDREFIERVSLFGQVFGGSTDLSPAATEWRTQTNTSTRNSYPEQSPTKPESYPDNEQERVPIKFLFSIFGELQTNKSFDSIPAYMQDNFNSMKKLAISLGINEQNVLQMIEGNLSFIPNQLKSMLVVAVSQNDAIIAGQYDAVRNIIVDQEFPRTQLTDTTAFLNTPETPYDLTYDSMKIYSKMLAYWMNYKELFVVEYLSGFKKTSPDLMSNQLDKLIRGQLVSNSLQPSQVIATNPYTPNPLYFSWSRLTSAKLRDSDNRNLICRIRTINANDFVSSEGTEKQELYSKSPDLFNLPLYNKYFILGSSPPKSRPPLNQEPPVIVEETTAPVGSREVVTNTNIDALRQLRVTARQDIGDITQETTSTRINPGVVPRY